ncbi:glucose-6-phosphate dehydrogenase [Candidatus Woesearchaeota archaeon]|nr:glucose-6-phosphate dehydrogenase [Candidatus Woesearchaeota archaeon]
MEQVTFIILGATGDLTKRKIIPAIYRLLKNKKISRLALVGVARKDLNMDSILQEAQAFIGKVNKTIWNRLKSSSYYCQLDFYNNQEYQKLGELLQQIEKKHHLSGNRLFYLATLPEHFDTITENLFNTKIARETTGSWRRLVYEKPFGSDLASAKKINHCICRVFKENQIFRVDHYLGKELVGNISMLRFTNRVLEPLWNSLHVESIQVVMNEKIGIEGRGNFYDKYGALKDVIQNHVLQMMALTCMEAPQRLSGDYIREEKAKVLKAAQVKEVLLGQYEGYASEPGVEKESRRETFAALKLRINNRRWKNVPIYLKSGKELVEKATNIHIIFKKAGCLLNICPTESNVLTIRVQPNEGFELNLFAKRPGVPDLAVPVKMDFCHSCITKQKSPEAYEVLLSDVIKGDQTLFVRNDEIEYAWKIIDGIRKEKVHSYKKGTTGPEELKLFEQKNGMKWLS